MKSLIGRYEYSVDPKNRVFVPKDYRDQLPKEGAESFILSRGLDRCLLLYLPSQWDRLLEDPSISGMKDKRAQSEILLAIQSNAHPVAPDEQGRILIPQHLKEYAGLEKEVVIAGMGRNATLWNPKAFAAKDRAAQARLQKMSRSIPL